MDRERIRCIAPLINKRQKCPKIKRSGEMEAFTTTLDDKNGSTICENELHVSIPSIKRSLKLSLIQEETEIEPLFSGAAWAGSVLWVAASTLVDHLLLSGTIEIAGTSVLELGCGLGIPGMVCKLLGASEVVLTEQPTLVPLLMRNVAANFIDDESPSVVELSWGTESTRTFMKSRSHRPFGTILICDCVFEPLYGDSWKLLCESLLVLCADATTKVFISCERRTTESEDGICADGIDDFLELLRRDFEVSVAWNAYDDAELGALLKASHVQGQKKPLRIFSATRKGFVSVN